MDPQIPTKFAFGTAKEDGDCFFDSVAQCLRQSLKKQRKKCTIKSLRKICAQHAKKPLQTVSWLKTELEKDRQRIDEYSENVVYCAEGIEKETHLSVKDLIWGRPLIEGRIICGIFKVKLHVFEKEMRANNEMWIDQVVDNNGVVYINNIYYESKDVIHILNRGNGHFEPVLQTSFVSKSRTKRVDFQTKKGTKGITGQLYEIKLSMLFLLRGLRETDHFKLANNVEGAGAFDDVIFKYTTMQDGNSKSKTIFLQAKHKENEQGIGLDQLLAKKEFDLKLYFKSYLDIKKNFSNSQSKGGIFSGEFEDCEFIFYTNYELNTEPGNDLNILQDKWNETDVSKMIGSRKGHIVQLKNNKTIVSRLRSDEATAKDVNDFLKKLHIFIGQSKEDELDDVIKQEIRETYGENGDKIFVKVKDTVERWWKEEQFFLTKEQQYFLDEKHDIQLNELGIQKIGVQFKEKTIRKFADLIRKHRILNVVADEGAKLLSIIPITQALDSNPEWKDECRKWIFMNLDQLLNAKRHILQGYYSKNVIVIDWTRKNEYLSALQKLSGTMQRNKNIRIIFITEQFELGKVCGKYFNVHTEFDNSTLKDLTIESQEMIWAKKVNFQGKETELSDLIDIRDNTAANVITSQTLMQLINNENLFICKEPPRLHNLEAAYAKLNTRIPIDELTKVLLKKCKKPPLFLIRGINMAQLLNRLKIKDGSSNANAVKRRVQVEDVLPNQTRSEMDEKFKQIHAGKMLRNCHCFEADSEHFYLRKLYNLNFYTNRKFSFPWKVTIEIDILLQINLMESFGFVGGTRKNDVINLLETCAANDQEQYKTLCDRNKIRFPATESDAESLFDSIQKESVHWLKVNEDDRDYFTLHKSRGPFHRLYTKHGNCDPGILIKAKNPGSIFIVSGNAGRQKVKGMLETSAIKKRKRFDEYCESRKIVFIAEKSELICNVQPMHYLTIHENDLKWLRSNGSFKWLRDNVNMHNRTFKEKQLCKLVHEKCVIIANDPGMGKSATLTSLSGRMRKTNWVIRIDFRECNAAIEKLKSNAGCLNMESVIDFISNVNSTGVQSDLRKQLLLHKLQPNASEHRPILILFDAFDEMKNEQQQQILFLLKFLKDKSSAKVWVTTRRNKVEELENCLLTFATKLEQLDGCEQEDFLYKFWRIHNFDGNLRSYARNLLKGSKMFLGEEMIKFMGVPLQLRMLAEVFHNDALNSQGENNSGSNFQGMNIKSMYQRFIDAKYNIYFREKSLLIEQSQYIIKSVLKSFNKHHQYIAFNMLFPEEMGQICKNKFPSKEDESDLKSVGIIQSYGSEDNIYFIHWTFAEYFVAILFNGNLNKSTEKFKSTIQILQQQMFLEANVVIRRFLDRLLAEELPMHMAALEDDIVELLQHLCENRDDIKFDKLGRTPLHLSAQEGHLNLVKVFLDEGWDYCKCDVFGKNPLHYATMNGHVDVVKHLVNYTADIDIHCNILRLAFQVNLEFGCSTVTPAETEYLSSYLAKCVNQHDKNEQSCLQYAAANQHWDIACILIANGADIRCLTEEIQKNLLQFAFRYSHRDESLLVIGLLLKFPHNFNVKGLDTKYNCDTLNPGNNFLARRNLRLMHLKTHCTKYSELFDKKYLLKCLDVLSTDFSNVFDIDDLLAKEIKNENVYIRSSFTSADVNAVNACGETRLHIAVKKYDLDRLKHLVNTGADFNIINVDGNTALDYALDYAAGYTIKSARHVNSMNKKIIMDTVRYLLVDCNANSALTANDKNIALRILTTPDLTSLHNAVTLSTPLFVHYLIENGADVNVKDKYGRTPLYYAALESMNDNSTQSHLNMVKMLLENGAIYDLKDKDNESVLKYNVKNEVFELLQNIDSLFQDISKASAIITYVLPRDTRLAFCNARDANNNTLLHLAASKNDKHALNCLLLFTNYTLLNAQNNDGNTPLHFAAVNGYRNIVKLLLQYRSIVNSKNREGDTALKIAHDKGHYCVVELLQEIDNIFNAIKNYNMVEFEKIIRKRSCVHIRDEDNNTLLHYAAKKGHLDMVKLLLKYGAQYNPENKNGMTPLNLANKQPVLDLLNLVHITFEYTLNNETAKIINSLKEIQNSNSSNFSAVIKSANNTWNTLLHLSARQNNVEVVRFLLQSGAPYNAENNKGEKPNNLTNVQVIKELFYYTELLFMWSDNLIYTLSDAKMSPEDFLNATDNNGSSILHYAGIFQSERVNYYRMKCIIKNGADINATNNTGNTVLDFVIVGQNLDLVKILLKNGVDISKLTADNLKKLKQICDKKGRHDIKIMLKHNR